MSHLCLIYLQVFVVDFAAETKPRVLTSGEQGATHSPAFSHDGNKVAWLELDEDGYEADRRVSRGSREAEN